MTLEVAHPTPPLETVRRDMVQYIFHTTRMLRTIIRYHFGNYKNAHHSLIDLCTFAFLRHTHRELLRILTLYATQTCGSCSKKQSSPISQTLKLHCVGSGSTILRSILYVNFLLLGTALK